MKNSIAIMLTLLLTVYVTALNAEVIDKRDCQNWNDVATVYNVGSENLLREASIIEIPDPLSTNQEITDCYIKLPAANLFGSAPDGIVLFYNPTAGPYWFKEPVEPYDRESFEFSPFIVLNTGDDGIYPILGIATPWYRMSLYPSKQPIKYMIGSGEWQMLNLESSWHYRNGRHTNFTKEDATYVLHQVDWLVSDQSSHKQLSVRVNVSGSQVFERRTFTLYEHQLQAWVSVLRVATSNEYAEILGGKVILDNSDELLGEVQPIGSDLECWEADKAVELWYGFPGPEELIEIPNPHVTGTDCYFRGFNGESVFLWPTASFATDYTKGNISIFLEAPDDYFRKLKTGFYINTIPGVEVPTSTRVYYTIDQNPPVRAFEGFEFAYNESEDNYQIGMEYRNSDYLGMLTEINNAYLEYQYVNPETNPEVTFTIGPAGRFGSITLTEGELRAWAAIETIVKQENDEKSYRQRKYAKWLNTRWFTPSAPDL